MFKNCTIKIMDIRNQNINRLQSPFLWLSLYSYSETATSSLPSVNSLPIHPYRGVAIRSGWDYFLAKEKR